MGVAGRRFARTVALLFVLPAVVGGLLGLGLVWGGFDVDVGGSTGGSGSIFGPPPLKPIAIPRTACPYLNVVRVASSKAEAYWNGDAFKKLDTPAGDEQLDALLAPLDFSVRVAATQVPARLRVELADVAHQVEIGRALIAYGRAMDPPFLDALAAGVRSLSNASDLVGNACGFPLADVSL